MCKKCSKCQTDKPMTDFSKNKRSKDGLQSICKLCYNAYIELNRDILKKNKLVYNEKNKVKISELKRIIYINNSDEIKLKSKEYSENNKIKIKRVQ